VKQLDRTSEGDREPPREMVWGRRPIGIEVASHQGPQRLVPLFGLESGQPAVRVGVRHVAAAVGAEAQHAAMGRRTGELAPARPFGLERVHRAFYGPRPGTLPDLLR